MSRKAPAFRLGRAEVPQFRHAPQRPLSSAARGYGYRWQKARAAFLAEHPLCVECMRNGRVRPAAVVDHIKPHRGDPELFWDETNWQGLCKPHHDAKTAREDGGWGNPRKGHSGSGVDGRGG